MHCIKCGTALPPEMTTCPSCGTPTPYNVTASDSEVSSDKEASTASDNAIEEKVPPTIVSQAEDAPLSSTVTEGTVLQQSPQPGIPPSQNVTERTVLQQPPRPSAVQQGPQPPPARPQPSPPGAYIPQPNIVQLPQGQQPQATPWQAQPGMPQPYPGQQPGVPQAYPGWWQPQLGVVQPPQGQPWPQPFPGQPPQAVPRQPLPWPQQGQQPAVPQAYPAWQQPQPGLAQPPPGQPWPQPFPGQPWPQPFPGQLQPQPGPVWQQPQPGMPQSLPMQQATPPAMPISPAQTLPAEPAPERQGLSLAMTLLLIILALLIIGGSGLIYYVAAAHPANLQTQATSAAQSFLTAQPQSRSPQGIYVQATTGKPTISDPLSSPGGRMWSESRQTNGSCTFTGGAFHLNVSRTGLVLQCFSSNSKLSNFAFQVQVTITQGLVGGLLFRVDDTRTNYYSFFIFSDGFYQFILIQGVSAQVLNSGPSSAIKTGLGQPNLLTVIAHDNNIYLYINKQYVATISDSTYTSGTFGLFAASGANPSADVAFSNAQVWAL